MSSRRIPRDIVLEIRALRRGVGNAGWGSPVTLKALAQRFGISVAHVSKIARGDRRGRK